jgi:hypothetical protein
MLQRLRVLQDAAATGRPTRLLPHLWMSGAVEAHSLHVLRHLGITHVLNATQDLLLPEPATAFRCGFPEERSWHVFEFHHRPSNLCRGKK